MEKHYVFIKNNKVANIAVFAEQDDDLAKRVVDEQGYDSYVWVNDSAKPSQYATFDGSKFIEPTEAELLALGIISPAKDEFVSE